MAPAVRARHMKTILAALSARAPDRAVQVRERFGSDAVRAVAEASAVEWLDVGLNLALTRRIEEVLGRAGCHQFFRAHSEESFQTPVFRALVDGAIALFGLDPGSWARLVPSGWGLVFRDVGRWTVERNVPGEVRLELRELPPACVADDVWPASVAASLCALITIAKVQGSIRLDRVDPRAQLAHYTVAWVPARPR